MFPRMFMFTGLLLLSGCLWPVRERTDQAVYNLVDHAFDQAPEMPKDSEKAPAKGGTGGNSAPGSGADNKNVVVSQVPTDVKTMAFMTGQGEQTQLGEPKKKLDLTVPSEVPGAEVPRVVLPPPEEPVARQQAIHRLYPPLAPLLEEPVPLPPPEGKPYTLSDFQRLAAENSPALRQAASDVEAARGALIQAQTYPNPTLSYIVDPANNNSTMATIGGSFDQVIKTGGKMKLGVAAAQQDLSNAELALKRARSDLSTAIRNAYFGLLVARETMVVTKALARFTDDVYRIQIGLSAAGTAAFYEPASLRAQANSTRLAYEQAITSYIYAWKTLVATVGLRQLPLSEVAGSVDRFVPYFDYDAVLKQVLRNHTDVLTAQNVVAKARYNLQLAQITPIIPDVDVRASLQKDYALTPFGTYNAVSVSFPFPIWDQNKGNIIAAQAALVRASEESHRVEVTLTNGLAAAYTNYQNNLKSLKFYRHYILPDLVRAFRGVLTRRQIDQNLDFGTFVTAQQNLASNVITYLSVLGTLWSGVVGVADFLQTDDLFQLAQAHELPAFPDLGDLPLWPCGHGSVTPPATNPMTACPTCAPAPAAAVLRTMPPAGVMPQALPAVPATASSAPQPAPAAPPAATPASLSLGSEEPMLKSTARFGTKRDRLLAAPSSIRSNPASLDQ